MGAPEVIEYGTDSSGRTILMSRYMANWWKRVCDELGFEPTIVQGAFMVRVGGGAATSAGYHDGGGCLDLRTWDRTEAEVKQIIQVTRRLGAASWVRDHRHGMDPHIHFVLGSDRALAPGAAVQWRQYVAGRDGLSSNGPDYHWRPQPLVTKPPPEEDDMADYAAQLDRIEAQQKVILERLRAEGAIRKRLGELAKQGKADARELAELRDLVESLATEPTR